MSPLTKLFAVLILVIIQNANANREFINGTNYKCQDEGNLIELPNHLRKPCMLCTCKKSLVVCEKLKPCAANYREDRRRRSIRCIEEECCNVVQDVFLNNVDSNSKQVSYRTLDSDTSAGEVISNQIRTSTIRYVHCTNELARNNYQNAPQNDRPIDQPGDSHSGLFEFNLKPFGSRSTINTRSVTAHPAGMDRQPDGLCTLSNSLNPDTSKHRQYITTFDGMRMRLRNRDHCHFVFARDCAGEQFTIHLLYSANNHLYANRSLAGRQATFDLNRSTPDRSTADRSASDDRFLDSINLTSAFHTLDGKSTSNYTQRYLSTLRQSRISSKEKLNLFVRIGKRKLRLDHNLNVKLDNRLILLPYVHRGLKIVKHQSYVILKSEIGLKIIWSGQEVVASLPRYYQRRTCGLCSNFNGDLTDDLKNRKNQAVSQLRFFQSWTTGKNRQCLVSKKRAKSSGPESTKPQANRDEENLIKNNTTCKWTFKRKMKATRFCNSLKINLPLKCQGPEVKNYFEDCLEKMCPCNRKCCNCEVLGSYVAKCAKTLENDTTPQQLNMTAFRDECPSFDFNSTSQLNDNLNQSRAARESDPPKSEHVELPKCPEGSLYSPCAPIDKYKVTCSDLLPRSESSDRLPEQMDVCQPGCKCRASTVWSDSRFEKCVPIDLCHSLSSNIRKRTINSLNSVLRPRLTFLN